MEENLMKGAVHGLAKGKGGKIAGSPEGAQGDTGTGMKWKFDNDETKNQQGAIIGSPVGIEGKVRTQMSKGRMDAMKRRAG